MAIVQPTDDLMVAGVQVIVLDDKGKGDWWEYAPNEEGKVVVEVRGLPGNVVKVELESNA